MIFREIVFAGERLDAAASAGLVQRAMRYDSDVTLEAGLRKINGKSLMGVVSMGLKRGDRLTVIVSGDDEKRALDDITDYLNRS